MSRPPRPARPLWSRIILVLCALLLAVSPIGLVLGQFVTEQHGYVVAQPWDHPYLWIPLGAAAATVGLAALLRWRWVTLVAAVLAVPAVWVSVFSGALFLGVTRGTPVVSPKGEWAVRIDNRGFQEPLYALITMEHGGPTSRYWQAGDTFSPDTFQSPTEKFEGLRWTSDDTFELASNRRTFRFRMTHQGPIQVS